MVTEVRTEKAIAGETVVSSEQASVEIGDRLGFYRAMSQSGPVTPTELARVALVSEQFTREWLDEQARAGYVEFDAASGRYANWCSLPRAA